MSAEAYKWPPKVSIAFYGRGECLVAQSTARDLDLADVLMLHWRKSSRSLRMSMSTQSTRWPAWTEEALQRIEALIRYDLGFDGYIVTLKRLTAAGGPCRCEFLWALRIRER